MRLLAHLYKEIIQGKPTVTVSPQVGEKETKQLESGKWCHLAFAGCEHWKGIPRKEIWAAVKTKKGKKMVPSPKSSIKECSCAHPWEAFWVYDLQNCKIINCLVLNHYMCGNMLQQQLKTNTKNFIGRICNWMQKYTNLKCVSYLPLTCYHTNILYLTAKSSHRTLQHPVSFPHTTFYFIHYIFFLKRKKKVYICSFPIFLWAHTWSFPSRHLVSYDSIMISANQS